MRLGSRLAACAAIIAGAAAGQLVTVQVGPAWPDTFSWWGVLGAPTAAIVFFASADAAKPFRDGIGTFVLAFLLGCLNAIWVARLMMWDGVPERWTLGPSAWLTVVAVPLALVAGAVTSFAGFMQRRGA